MIKHSFFTGALVGMMVASVASTLAQAALAQTSVGDMPSLQFWSSQGIAGLLAAGVFMVYRKDAKGWIDLWHGQSEQLMQVVKENTAAITALVQILNRNK